MFPRANSPHPNCQGRRGSIVDGVRKWARFIHRAAGGLRVPAAGGSLAAWKPHSRHAVPLPPPVPRAVPASLVPTGLALTSPVPAVMSPPSRPCRGPLRPAPTRPAGPACPRSPSPVSACRPGTPRNLPGRPRRPGALHPGGVLRPGSILRPGSVLRPVVARHRANRRRRGRPPQPPRPRPPAPARHLDRERPRHGRT